MGRTLCSQAPVPQHPRWAGEDGGGRRGPVRRACAMGAPAGCDPLSSMFDRTSAAPTAAGSRGLKGYGCVMRQLEHKV